MKFQTTVLNMNYSMLSIVSNVYYMWNFLFAFLVSIWSQLSMVPLIILVVLIQVWWFIISLASSKV